MDTLLLRVLMGLHFLVLMKINASFLYEKKDNCCPLVVQSIHHKNHVKEGYANVPKSFYLRNAWN